MEIHFFIFDFFIFMALACVILAIYKYGESRYYLEHAHGSAVNYHQTIKAGVVSLFVFIILNGVGINMIMSTVISSATLIFCHSFIKKLEQKKKMQTFDKALNEGIQIISTSLRAGLTLRESLLASVKSSPRAFGDEIQTVLRDLGLGVSMEDALMEMRKRVNTPIANLALGAMIISNRQGGDLPAMLLKIGNTINQRERIAGKLKALTAQGRMQAILVASAPPFLFVFMSFYDPKRMALLTQNFLGNCLLALAVILEIIGIFVTRKIMELKY
ncbi:MAG: type II secretion system F family protein [Bdellovibrio sp.]|nr:type II secretion system F family protein [Bdellovibrio sp.]